MQCFHLTHTILAWHNFYIYSMKKKLCGLLARYLNDKIKYYFIRMTTFKRSEKSGMNKRSKKEYASHVLYKSNDV